MPNLSIQKQIMLTFTALSDTQSELMQGGWTHPHKYEPCKPKHPGKYGHKSTTHTNISVIAGQESFAQALTLGKLSFASNDVVQSMSIGISV